MLFKLFSRINKVFKYLCKFIPTVKNKKNANFHIAEAFKLIEKHRLKEVNKSEIFTSKNVIAEEYLREFLEENSPNILFDVFKKDPAYMVRIFSIALLYDWKPVKQNRSTK